MEVTMRRASSTDTWGYVEQFKIYTYGGKGFIESISSVSYNKNTNSFFFSTPYALRGGLFVPLKQIEEEVGIDKYIKAKKPFYSLISDGFVAHLKARVDYATGECDLSNTIVEALQVYTEESYGDEGKLYLRKIINMGNDLKELLETLAVSLASCKGDRETFLKTRIG